MHDQAGMRARGAVLTALASSRIRQRRSTGADTTGCASAGYRVVYTIDDDVITIDRVDRVAAD
jgi:hypothetical protein